MALDPGFRLGPYEITGPLGAGGMGEVYRARDTRLGREVAVKILPIDAAEAAGSRERFEREAQVVSSLSHRNICTLHDVGREGETDYLVMELLEGETLAKRLERGPLKLEEALRVGAEIASGLDAAHRAGVVHRDLKPGNVMLTRGGAKVLDFGIAKLTESGPMPGHLPTAIPTRTTPLTAKGALVGTLNYMSPEQLEGKTIDHRADIFAFGAVLYEMLTGRRAFDGASQASVIAGILERDPVSAASIAPMTPAPLDRLVRECLAKDPEARRQSAHDIASELRGIAEAPLASTSVGAGVVASGQAPSRVPWIAAVSALVLAAIFATLWLRRPVVAPRALEMEISLRSSQFDGPPVPAVSPDQSSIAYVDATALGGTPQLWVRRLDDAKPRLIEGTDGATCPFWSQDGREIAYFAAPKLMAVPAAGGRSRVICDAAYGVGGIWTSDGTIVFSGSFNEGLKRVDANGGRPEAVTALDATRGESGHIGPVPLPGGRRFLFLSRTTAREPNRIEVASLDGGPRKVVLEADALAGYVAPWLLFVRNGVLFAQRFDPETGALSGERITVNDDAMYHESWATAGISAVGDTLAWAARRPAAVSGDWFDARGASLGKAFTDDGLKQARLSPDGARVALAKLDPTRGADDLWVLDLARGTKTRLTKTDGDEDVGPWLADGSEMSYCSDDRGPYSIFRVATDGSGEPKQVLLEPEHDWCVHDTTRDGHVLYGTRDTPGGLSDIWTVSLDAPDKRAPWVATEYYESGSRVSPDGRWVAFNSGRSGALEVYVRRADGGSMVQVSIKGGSSPRWDPDGRSMRYVGRDGHIHRVPLSIEGNRIAPGLPDRAADIDAEHLVDYDIAPDGRVLVLRDLSGAKDGFVVRTGWLAGLGTK